MTTATLDTETLEMVLATIREYAAKELKPEYLRELEEKGLSRG